jgi:hypothetical protein
MSLPETPARTEAQQILDKLDQVIERQDQFTNAVNGMGLNLQWIIDNVSRIFQMFGSPQFMQQMMGVMGNVNAAGAAESTDGTSPDGTG